VEQCNATEDQGGIRARRITFKTMSSGYFFIFLTITFTVLGQLCVKFGMSKVVSPMEQSRGLLGIVIGGFLQPWVLTGLVCAGLAAVSWFPAISRLPISVAYPFMALPIVLVLLLAPICFAEQVTLNQWLGVLIVSFGLWLAAR